uniref:Uncharacterized protein n=1 Tax=Sphaerodactylus townsendi TaxID=933632 RepID=A0ACB8GCY2_9SAUR
MKFFNPPVVNQWIQGRLEVAEPKEPSAYLKKVVLVIKVAVECGNKAVGGKGCPADYEDNKQNQYGCEGTSFKAHIDVHLKGSLETHEAEFAGLTEAYAIRVAMNTNCIVP